MVMWMVEGEVAGYHTRDIDHYHIQNYRMATWSKMKVVALSGNHFCFKLTTSI